MTTRTITQRQISKFQFCDKHAPWFAGETRERKLETMIEGGPGSITPGCVGGKCRLWPGRDTFVAEVCDGEMDLEWTRPA